MANVTIALKLFIDDTGTGLTSVNPQAIVTVGSDKFACSTDRVNLTLTNGYVEMSVEGRNIYKYTVGDTFGGVAKTASEMFDSLQQGIAKA